MFPDVVQLLVTHALSIVGFAMATVLMAVVVVQRRAPGTTFAWLLAIVLIPYLGVPLFLVFGGRKLRGGSKTKLYDAPTSRAAPDGIAAMLCASGAPAPRAGNETELHTTGEAAFVAVVAELSAAKHSIRISTLILGNDEVGDAILDVLEAKARAGVEVRVLLDSLYKWRASRRRLRALEAAGGRYAWFMPVWHVPFLSRVRANLRLHRKIIVVDGAAAIVGGMNLAREYMGPTPLQGRWRDLSARLVGTVVADLDAVFRSDWKFAAGEELAPAPADHAWRGEATIQVVGSGPDVPNDLIYDAFLSSVFEARRRLWIATPYFVPDEGLARALVLAARRGVDVRVLVPAKSNHATADFAGASYLREVAAAGAKIMRFTPSMLHAKAVLVDDALAVIGSANLDMRSLFLNYEIALFQSSPAQVTALAAWFDAQWPLCIGLEPAGAARALLESVARLIGPLE